MRELRKHERFELALQVRVIRPDSEAIVGTTRDFSDGGAFIQADFVPPPAAGDVLLLQLAAPVNGQPAPILKGRVVRVAAEGVAFQFIKDE
jgi:hypothetical protein